MYKISSFSRGQVYLSSEAFLYFFGAKTGEIPQIKTETMGRRFNNLDAALKYLRPVGATEDTEIPEAPVGSQLRRFQDYKGGKRAVTYNRAASSNPGNETFVVIKPFALPQANTDEYLVTISGRALNGIGNTGLNQGILNISDDATKIAGAQRINDFTPARATVKNITGTSATTKTSKLTGDPYKSKAGASYTFPMGRGTDDPSYSTVKSAVVAAVNAGDANRSVSFKPEIYR